MAFVDDIEIFLTVEDDDIDKLVDLADTTMQTWKGVLQATGGDMRSKKCAWTLLEYGSQSLNRQLREKSIHTKDEDGRTRPIHQYNMSTARVYLGVLQQA